MNSPPPSSQLNPQGIDDTKVAVSLVHSGNVVTLRVVVSLRMIVRWCRREKGACSNQ